MDSFLHRTIAGNFENIISTYENEAIILYSNSAIQNAKFTLDDNFISFCVCKSGANSSSISSIEAKINKNLKYVVTIGGGSVMDLGKHIASSHGLFHVCIPSALTTNAYSTNKVAIKNDIHKHTLDSKLPDQIIFDSTLIATAGKLNLYGLVDILSIHTALHDWELASIQKNELIDINIYERSKSLLEEAIKLEKIDVLDENDQELLMTLFKLIGESGQITNAYGNGRPESGSEHILARTIEEIGGYVHGESVAISIILMSIIQDNLDTRVLRLLKNTGALNKINEMSFRSVIVESLVKTKPRLDRYSVFNEIKKFDRLGSELTYNKALEKIIQCDNDYLVLKDDCLDPVISIQSA